MRLRILFFVMLFVILFALLGGRSAFAQKNCEEFAITPSGMNCYAQYFIPWVAFGNGWTSKLRGANISSDQAQGPIQFTWRLLNTSNMAYFTDNKWLFPQSGGIAGHWVLPNESIEVTLLSLAVKCDKLSCLPDPSTTAVGSMAVWYQAEDPAWLRGLPRPSVQFNYVGGLQATEPALDPAPVWRGPITATADGHENYSFAIGNPGGEEVVVQGTITNQKGINLGIQTWTIPSGGTMGLYLTSSKDAVPPGFGSDPFPEGKNFTGWVEFRVISPAGGMVVPVALQYTGNAMSSADIQSFNK